MYSSTSIVRDQDGDSTQQGGQASVVRWMTEALALIGPAPFRRHRYDP